MGLLDPDLLRNKLKGLLGGMPLVQAAQGQAQVSQSGLLAALRSMPVFDQQAGMRDMQEAALNIGPLGLGKIVYHGSPHKFDKFDASKIGTGEGAQAYGHGVYLADAEGVAKGYAESLGKPVRTIDGQPMRKGNLRDELSDLVGNFGPDVARSNLQNYLDSSLKYSGAKGKQYQDGLRKQLEMLDAKDYGQAANSNTGALYKADLPDEWIPKMLDWDKPLNDQPEVLKALESHPTMGRGSMGWRGAPEGLWERAMSSPTRTGEWLYREIANNAPKETAGALQQAGIPGIRYLDGGSRGKGQGSYNYVVFPGLEDKVKILERNGVPLNGLLGK